jgi:hypothetical protein
VRVLRCKRADCHGPVVPERGTPEGVSSLTRSHHGVTVIIFTLPGGISSGARSTEPGAAPSTRSASAALRLADSRKGRRPHCALNLSPADPRALGVRDGDPVRVATRRGAVTLPAQLDAKLLGFGMT